MLAAMFIIPVNAAKEKAPFGTVVEAQYTTTAPDMSERAYPDATWGEPVIHIDSKSPNTAVTDYMKGRGETTVETDRTLSFDAYMKWTDSALYLCFTSPDNFVRGAVDPVRGDGFQIDIVYGIMDMSHYSAELCDDPNAFRDTYSYLLTFFVDDDTFIEYGAGIMVNCNMYFDEKSSELVAKYELPFTQLGMSTKEQAKDGDVLSFSMLRIDGNKDDESGYTGWLEWGNFFDKDKGCEVPAAQVNSIYVPSSLNSKTKTGNSIKLVGKSSGGTTTSTQPTVPGDDGVKTPIDQIASEGGGVITPPRTEPSSWAKAEVDAAIAAGLVPAELQTNYNDGISRAELSKMLGVLIDKVYGTDPVTGDASFTDTTDPTVLRVANLGIINGYKQNDGTFKFIPDNVLRRAEMAAIINRVAKLCGKTVDGFDSEVKFADTATHWCGKELGWPVHNGIVKGTSATQFSPENTLTVEQTIMMIYRTYTALK